MRPSPFLSSHLPPFVNPHLPQAAATIQGRTTHHTIQHSTESTWCSGQATDHSSASTMTRRIAVCCQQIPRGRRFESLVFLSFFPRASRFPCFFCERVITPSVLLLPCLRVPWILPTAISDYAEVTMTSAARLLTTLIFYAVVYPSPALAGIVCNVNPPN
ncbi:hypothetical protein VTK56DRAFT_1462 [Thermocarpiscus australiensis]